jgi:hypothetical protein
VAKEIDETEKRLKHYERTIFELKEYVDSKSRETDYEVIYIYMSFMSFNHNLLCHMPYAILYNCL